LLEAIPTAVDPIFAAGRHLTAISLASGILNSGGLLHRAGFVQRLKPHYVVLGQQTSVGRLYKEAIDDEFEWHWSINTSPYPAPPPHNGMTKTLEDESQALKIRYEEMKRL
jgi:hypothetical protein